MPRVHKRAKRRTAKYGEWARYQLLHGYDPLDCLGESFGFDDDFDEPAARAAWEELRGELLPRWIAEHPGSRPAAWWWFESPGRRERVDGVQHPFDDRLRQKQIAALPEGSWARRHAHDLWFGVPRLSSTRDGATAQYETEAEFLTRHNLLTPAEKTELFS